MNRGIHIRFIPAGAGNTSIIALLIYTTPVYPRWRGEHTKHT
ncbi:putative membrane protein [Escherichia coli 2867750]|nr:putative membrane protein [Escherichia coli 2867750]